jgi:hypothetical protein
VVSPARLFWALLAAFTGALALAWALLPEQVPMHFTLDGRPDRTVGHDRAVLEMAAVGYALAAILGGTAAATARMPVSMLNAPHKEHWSRPENQPRLRALVRRDLWVVADLTTALVTVVVLVTVAVADDAEPRLGAGAATAVGGFLLALLGYSLWARRSYRPQGAS